MELELSDHKKQIDQLHSGNETLKDRFDLSECYNHAFDLANLSIFLSILKRNMKSGKRYSDDLENFVQRLQNELISHNMDINIIYLHDLIQNRNMLIHGKMCSKVDRYDLSPKFIYNGLVRIMMNQLKQTQFKRYAD